jgi:hypothetical protein
VAKGTRVVWCDEAFVTEPVEKARLNLRWLVLRALGGGQEFARKTITGMYGPVSLVGRIALLLDAILKMAAAGVLAVVLLPFGLHRSAHWLIRAAANFGKISIFWGWRYVEYA